MPRFRSMVMAAVALALLGGCTKREEAIPRQGSIDFRVDARRLGDRFEHAGSRLALRAPIGWNPLPDSVIAAAMARVGEGPGPRLFAMYRQEPEGATLAVSGYPAGFAGSLFDSIAVRRLGLIRRAHPGARIDDGRFSYHGFEIVQFRTVDSVRVAFQLLVNGPSQPLMQLDYLVPRSIYPRELESVESSIGSLEPSS